MTFQQFLNCQLLVLELPDELGLNGDGSDVHLVPGYGAQHLKLWTLNVQNQEIDPAVLKEQRQGIVVSPVFTHRVVCSRIRNV